MLIFGIIYVSFPTYFKKGKGKEQKQRCAHFVGQFVGRSRKRMINIARGDDGLRRFVLGEVSLNQGFRTFREGFGILKESHEKGVINDRQGLVGLKQLRQERPELDREEIKHRMQMRAFKQRARIVSLEQSKDTYTFLCNGRTLDTDLPVCFDRVKPEGVEVVRGLFQGRIFGEGERNQALALLDLEFGICKFEQRLKKAFAASRDQEFEAVAS